MAPPGRRRSLPIPRILSLCNVLLLVVFFISSPAFAASAVLGIDIGTEYIKAALVKPGIPLEIVLTKDSKRKESSAVAFKPSIHGAQDADFPERLYGGDALALTARFPADVYPNLKPLLGATTVDSLPARQYSERYPALNMMDTGKGSTVGFQSGLFKPKDEPFMVEELLAMELKNIRRNAESMAGKAHTVRDVVIAIPAYYTADERRAVQLAANLAGLEVIGLISDGLAVGLNYAMPRTFPNINQGERAEHHLIYDMGAGSTTATILKFQARTVKDVGRFNKTVQEASVVGMGWNRLLGGDALNQLIVDDMVTQFVQSTGAKKMSVDVMSVKRHGRAMAKLWKEAERLRQVLSANTATSANFEGLYEDIDFKYKLSRAEFEKLASAYAVAIGAPINQALTVAGLSFTDVDSVVLHGGAVRTPFIQKILETLVGDPLKLKSNVNADEAAVFGAGFKAAGLSPSFKVKDIRDSDSAGYSAVLRWISESKERQQKIFVPTSQVGAVKQLAFKNLEDFTLSINQELPLVSSVEAIESPVLQVQFTNLTASVAELVDKFGCKHVNISTTISLRLDPVNGLPEVLQGAVSCEADAEKKGIVEGFKGFLGFGSKKDQQVLDDEEVEPEPAPDVRTDPTPSSSSENATATDVQSRKGAKTESPKSKLQVIGLSFVNIPLGRPQPSGSDLQRIKDRLIAFDKSDQRRRSREEAFNNLEGFTYRARDMLSDASFISVSSASQREAIEKLLRATSEWLYEDGVLASLELVKAKLTELTDLVNPITFRKEEAAKRPAQIKLLQEALNSTSSVVKAIQLSIEEYSLAAASAAEAAESSKSKSPVAEAPPTASSSTGDEYSDVDDEPMSLDSASASPTAMPSPALELPTYTEADLADISSAYDAVLAWFNEKLAAQELLSPSEDPVLLSSDITANLDQLNKVSMDLVNKKPRVQSRSKTSSKKKASKTKTKKGKATASPEAEPSNTVSPAEGSSATAIPRQSDIEHGEL